MSRTLGLYCGSLFASLGLAGVLAAQQPAAPPNIMILPPATPSVPPPPPPPPPPASMHPTPPPGGVVDLTPHEMPGGKMFESHESHGSCPKCEEGKPAYLVSVEYLLVRPRRRANDYAIEDPSDNLTPQGKIKSVGYSADSGFRVSAGYRSSKGWEILGTYYYLHSGDENEASAPPGGVIYPTLTRPGLVDVATFASASTGLDLHIYDIEVAKTIHVDDSLSFRLGFGPRIASLHQTLTGYYFGGDATGTMVRSKTEFDGGGLMASGQADWILGRGLRLFGRSRLSMLYGGFTNHLRETDNGGLTVNADVDENYSGTVPVFELATGVAYEYRNLRVSVGYELANWFNVVDGPAFTNDFAEGKIGRRKSDLSLEGLFFQLGVAY